MHTRHKAAHRRSRKAIDQNQCRRWIDVRASRAGISMILVMFALSMSLVLTYSFIQTQSVLIQISENSSRQDLARNAARAGIRDALNRLNSLAWTGVNDQYEREFLSDSDGDCTYAISFETIGGSIGSVLELNVHSLGAWTSATNSNMRSEYQITAKMRLVPRLTGRSILPGDSATATDQITNPGDYDQIRQYALFAETGSSSLILDPCDRIDGNIWLYDNLVLYNDPAWSSSVREEFLEDVGKRFVTFPAGSSNLSETTITYPHPIAGSVTYYDYPSSSSRSDLSDLKLHWSTTSNRLRIPSTNFSAYSSYRLYEGGPLYQAVSLNSSLYNVTLKPTPDNPLGIFYRSGSLNVYDNVVIQGTLVATSKITFHGKGIHVTAFNWKGSDGGPLVRSADLWPRLPSVVAGNMEFIRETQTTLEGAIVCQGNVVGAGGSVDYPNVSNITYSGTATAVSVEQPSSIVTLREFRLLDLISANGKYAIWLETTGTGQTGATGSWYPITGVDSARQQVTVRGEIDIASPTGYQIKRHKQELTQIRGPICAETFDFNRLDEWVLSYSHWNDRKHRWEYENDLRRYFGYSELGFSEWLESPYNFPGWGSYYQTYGLNLEPTLHIQHLKDQAYRWEPPLFQPFDGSNTNPELSGYRWSLIDWKETQ